MGADGFALLDLLDRPGAPAGLQRLPKVQVLRRVWARHFERDTTPPAGDGGGGVRLRPKGELPPAAAGIESPYDPEARYRRRGAVGWAGYVGTNLFDIGLIAVADLVYAGPPVLDEVGTFSAFATLLGIAITAIALVGILERRDTTVARMGVDSLAIAVVYLSGLVVLYQLR